MQNGIRKETVSKRVLNYFALFLEGQNNRNSVLKLFKTLFCAVLGVDAKWHFERNCIKTCFETLWSDKTTVKVVQNTVFVLFWA